MILSDIGEQGQERLLRSTAVVIGCGALGSHIATHLVRAGVGHVRLVDRDFIELNNLQRQVLYDETDVAQNLPKAVAAAARLRQVNSDIEIEAVVTDVVPDNAIELIEGAAVVLDGTDNFETRLLVNDACLKVGIPWIYGGAIGTYGMTMAIIPGRTPCFRCFLGELPAPGTTPTCDTVGVLGPVAAVVAALQSTEAIKLLAGREDALHGRMLYVDVWAGELRQLSVRKADEPCPACDLGQYAFLEARQGSSATTLCGRDAVQVSVGRGAQVSLEQLADRLRAVGQVAYNAHMLRFRVDGYELNVFPDGRTIVKGCTDPAVARSLYSRYVGL